MGPFVSINNMLNGLVLKLLVLLILELVYLQGQANSQSETAGSSDVEYNAGFSDNVAECSDDQNMFDMLGLKLCVDENGEGAGLSGFILVKEVIEYGYELEVVVFKETEVADELMYSCRIDFCSSLKEVDAPWYPVVVASNITSCPVEVRQYNIDMVILDMSSFKDMLTSQLCGPYKVYSKLIDNNGKEISCNQLDVDIYEKKKEDDEKKR